MEKKEVVTATPKAEQKNEVKANPFDKTTTPKVEEKISVKPENQTKMETKEVVAATPKAEEKVVNSADLLVQLEQQMKSIQETYLAQKKEFDRKATIQAKILAFDKALESIDNALVVLQNEPDFDNKYYKLEFKDYNNYRDAIFTISLTPVLIDVLKVIKEKSIQKKIQLYNEFEK